MPIKINLIEADSREKALAEFVPFHPNEPTIKHYNKPFAVDELQSPFYLG